MRVLREPWVSPDDTYMFSENAGLACLVKEDDVYYVCNGDWNGTRNGNEFTIHSNQSVLHIDDWELRSLHELTDEERVRWYLPAPMSMYDRFDLLEREAERDEMWNSDIAF